MTSKNLSWSKGYLRVCDSFLVFLVALAGSVIPGCYRQYAHMLTLKTQTQNYELDKFTFTATSITHLSNVCLAMVLIGALAALIRFSYLHQTKKLDRWHSLPEKSSCRFWSMVGMDLLAVVFALLLNFLLEFLLCGSFYSSHCSTSVYLQARLVYMLAGFVAFFAAYSVGCLCAICTNHLLYSIGTYGLFTFFDLNFLPLVYEETMDTFTRNPDYNAISTKYEYLAKRFPTPFHLLQNTIEQYEYTYETYFPTDAFLLFGVIAILGSILLLLGFLAYQKRQHTNADNMGAFSFVKPLLQVYISFTVIHAACCIQKNSNLFPSLEGFVIILLVLLLVHLVLTILLNLNIRTLFRKQNVIATLAGAVLALGYVGILALDLPGNNAVPDSSKVAAVSLAVNYDGDDTIDSYNDENLYFAMIEKHAGRRQKHAEEDFLCSNPDYIKSFCDAAKELDASSMDNYELQTYFANNVSCIATYKMAFYLTNGKTVSHIYHIKLRPTEDIPFRSLFEDTRIQAKLFPLSYGSVDAYENDLDTLSIDYQYSDNSTQKLLASEDSAEKKMALLKELQEVYQKDMAAHAPFDRFSLNFTLPYLYLSYNRIYGEEDTCLEEYYFIPENYESTRAFLKKNGISLEDEKKAN